MKYVDEVEEYVYQSYLKAESHLNRQDKDSRKRHPEYSEEIINALAGTECALVTGSKGKGSVCKMLSLLLQRRRSVGLMTSPHILTFHERFAVDGREISDEELAEAVSAVKPQFDKVEKTLPQDRYISPMGIQAAAALWYFGKKGTDFNIFECGKGARYDDVNNIPHEYAVINTIFPEHLRELGDTVEKIAEDKAYVIKPGVRSAYIAEQRESVEALLCERAECCGVPVKRYGRDFESVNIKYTTSGMVFDAVVEGRVHKGIRVPLLGEHQAKNFALALCCAEDIAGEISAEDCNRAMEELVWRGRLEILSREPFIILDACINRENCGNVIKSLQSLGISDCTLIVGIPDDKDYRGVICEMQSCCGKTILTKSTSPHYLFSPKLQQELLLQEEGLACVATESVEEALALAKGYGAPVCILGTTSLISDVEKLRGKLWGRK